MSENVANCLNCGSALTADYCADCGQRAKPARRPVIGLAQDVLIDTLALDGKLARSLTLLLVWPGKLARRYLDGKRASHTAPFRLYLFTSLAYFFIVFALISPMVNESMRSGEIILVEPDDEITQPPAEDDETTPPEAPEAPAEVTEDRPDWFDNIEKRIEDAIRRLQEDPRLFLSQTRENIPRVLLLAPLIYGLILAIFYFYRRRFLFYDHFVVSLYMHAALYAYSLIAIGLLELGLLWNGFYWFIAPLAIWGAIQPYAVLRQAYGSNWVSTVIKGLLTNTIYSVTLIALVTFGLTYSLYLS